MLFISTNSIHNSIVLSRLSKGFLSCCHTSDNIMHVWLALLSIVVKFNSVKSLQSHFWEGKHLRNGHISLSQPWLIQALPGVVPSTCVCARPRVRVSGSTARMFGSAETLANPLCASQCPVSEELWPLSSCSLLKPPKEKGEKRKREPRECKWVSVCAKTCPEGHTVRSDTHRGACSTVYVPAPSHSHVRVCTHLKLA